MTSEYVTKVIMNKISKEQGSVYCNQGAWKELQKHLDIMNPSKIFVLVDENTEELCLPHFSDNAGIKDFELLRISAGEAQKNINSCLELWNSLSLKGADRQSLLINLGGGVVTDMGGFVACTYQRGIRFINIPTSLLSMVDASVGGKTGVDLGVLKNQIGIIKNPEAVVIDTNFLKTLAENELLSGLAEVIKHGFIHSEYYLKKSFEFDLEHPEKNESLIWESVLIKNQIISEDPTEKGIRKTLNYGHTLGHAIESYFLNNSERRSLLHGEAIAIGMILETYISSLVYNFPNEIRNLYCKKILRLFPKVSFTDNAIEKVLKLLIFDKKNSHGKVRFVLLSDIGKAQLNCEVPEDLIKDSFNYYKALATD